MRWAFEQRTKTFFWKKVAVRTSLKKIILKQLKQKETTCFQMTKALKITTCFSNPILRVKKSLLNFFHFPKQRNDKTNRKSSNNVTISHAFIHCCPYMITIQLQISRQNRGTNAKMTGWVWPRPPPALKWRQGSIPQMNSLFSVCLIVIRKTLALKPDFKWLSLFTKLEESFLQSNNNATKP